MKTKQTSTRWLGLALACGTLTFAASTQAARPPKPPPSPAYVPVLLEGLRSSDGVIITSATDINNAGQVLGTTCIPGYDSAHYRQAFLLNPDDTNGDGKPEWFADADSDGQNDLMIGLGTLSDGGPTCNRGSYASAINDPGQVVGVSHVFDPAARVGTSQAFVIVPRDSDNDGRADLWYQGSTPNGMNELMLPLGRPPGMPASATPNSLNINNVGQIVGTFYYTDANSVYHYTFFLLTPLPVTPGVWQWFQDDGSGANALMTDLGDFMPRGINDGGQIVGQSYSQLGSWQAILRNPDGALVDLGAGGTKSEAQVINNRGQIGVWWQVDGVGHAGLLTPLDANEDGTADTWFQDTNGDGVNDLVVDFGALRSLENTYVAAHGLNDTGSVVGGSWHASPRDGLGYQRGGFLWENGGIQSLQSLTGGTFEFRDAYAINNARQIICEMNGGRSNPGLYACILLPTR